ncbi:MAG: hypothetical protein ACFFC3_09540 [Candidatus Odinarchaeota archaeon]
MNSDKNGKILNSDKDVKLFAKELNWDGSGTESDPIIIESTEGIPSNFEVINSSLYINIHNCKFKNIHIRKCENISINSSEFNYLIIVFSSNLLIRESTIKNKLELAIGHNIILKNNAITLLSMNYCYENEIIDCKIKNIDIKYSRANLLQENELNYNSLKNINNKYSFWQRNSFLKYSICSSLVFIILIGFMYIFFEIYFPEEISTWNIIAPLCLIFFISLSIYLFYTSGLSQADKELKKINKLKDNKVRMKDNP